MPHSNVYTAIQDLTKSLSSVDSSKIQTLQAACQLVMGQGYRLNDKIHRTMISAALNVLKDINCIDENEQLLAGQPRNALGASLLYAVAKHRFSLESSLFGTLYNKKSTSEEIDKVIHFYDLLLNYLDRIKGCSEFKPDLDALLIQYQYYKGNALFNAASSNLNDESIPRFETAKSLYGEVKERLKTLPQNLKRKIIPALSGYSTAVKVTQEEINKLKTLGKRKQTETPSSPTDHQLKNKKQRTKHKSFQSSNPIEQPMDAELAPDIEQPIDAELAPDQSGPQSSSAPTTQVQFKNCSFVLFTGQKSQKHIEAAQILQSLGRRN